MVHDVCILYVPQVTVSGTTVMFSGSMGNVTGLALMNGVTYSVSVVARNSVGSSGMFIVMLFVPCECLRPANVVLHMHTHLTSTHNEAPSRPLSSVCSCIINPSTLFPWRQWDVHCHVVCTL